MGRAAAEELKHFISRRVENYIPKYGRREVVEPRQCVLIGTTNRSAYLRDETGARRFWPVKVGAAGPIDIKALARDRDHLFAEATHRYRRDERWWPDRTFEAEHIQPQQAARFEADAWEQPIREWMHKERVVSATIYDVARSALFLDTGKIGTADQRRIADVLTHLGWERGKRTSKERRWFPMGAQ
jgi:predicted P-loop ATPase